MCAGHSGCPSNGLLDTRAGLPQKNRVLSDEQGALSRAGCFSNLQIASTKSRVPIRRTSRVILRRTSRVPLPKAKCPGDEHGAPADEQRASQTSGVRFRRARYPSDEVGAQRQGWCSPRRIGWHLTIQVPHRRGWCLPDEMGAPQRVVGLTSWVPHELGATRPRRAGSARRAGDGRQAKGARRALCLSPQMSSVIHEPYDLRAGQARRAGRKRTRRPACSPDKLSPRQTSWVPHKRAGCPAGKLCAHQTSRVPTRRAGCPPGGRTR